MKMNCSQCGYDCLGCFQRLQQNVEEQAKIILKRNFRIIEFSQRVGELEKQLAEAQAEVERLKDNISTGDFVYKAVSRQRDDFREALEVFQGRINALAKDSDYNHTVPKYWIEDLLAALDAAKGKKGGV